MPALRGHHLICLQFFEGEGYSAEFIGNLKRVLKSAETGEIDLRITADDVCEKCPYLNNTRCRYSEDAEEGITEMDGKALALLNLSPDARVKWNEVKRRTPGVFPVWYEVYCTGCSWKAACEKNSRYRQLMSFQCPNL